MWTATFGPLPGGLARVLTECTCSRPMASSSAEFISRKPAQIFVSGAPRKTACSWLPVSLSTHSTSTPRARKRPDKHVVDVGTFALNVDESVDKCISHSKKPDEPTVAAREALTGAQAGRAWRPHSLRSEERRVGKECRSWRSENY